MKTNEEYLSEAMEKPFEGAFPSGDDYTHRALMALKAMRDDLERKAWECSVENDLTPYGVAQFWYLKGFKDAETTERQDVPIEQTMKDAEAHFVLVWECHKNTGEV